MATVCAGLDKYLLKMRKNYFFAQCFDCKTKRHKIEPPEPPHHTLDTQPENKSISIAVIYYYVIQTFWFFFYFWGYGLGISGLGMNP